MDSLFDVVIALLLCTSFIKCTTVLSILRFGSGLVGFEFGVASLLVAFGLSIATLPPELKQSEAPLAFLQPSNSASVIKALMPQMAQQLDPSIVEGLFGKDVSLKPNQLQQDTSKLIPAFVLSQLKTALTLGLLLLIPFVLLDLVIAHILSLLGMQTLPVAVVSLPLKLLLFLAVDGWGLLGAKLLGGAS